MLVLSFVRISANWIRQFLVIVFLFFFERVQTLNIQRHEAIRSKLYFSKAVKIFKAIYFQRFGKSIKKQYVIFPFPYIFHVVAMLFSPDLVMFLLPCSFEIGSNIALIYKSSAKTVIIIMSWTGSFALSNYYIIVVFLWASVIHAIKYTQ